MHHRHVSSFHRVITAPSFLLKGNPLTQLPRHHEDVHQGGVFIGSKGRNWPAMSNWFSFSPHPRPTPTLLYCYNAGAWALVHLNPLIQNHLLERLWNLHFWQTHYDCYIQYCVALIVLRCKITTGTPKCK